MGNTWHKSVLGRKGMRVLHTQPCACGNPALLSAGSRCSHKAVDSIARLIQNEIGIEISHKSFSSCLKHCTLAAFYQPQ